MDFYDTDDIFTDNKDQDRTIDEIILMNTKSFQQLEKLIDKINSKFIDSLKSIKRKIYAAQDNSLKQFWIEQNSLLEEALEVLEKNQEVWEGRIDKSMLIYSNAIDFFNAYRGTFFNEKKKDTFYFLFNLMNVFIRLSVLKINQNNEDSINLLDDAFIKSCLNKLEQNMVNAENYVLDKPLKDFNYGVSEKIDDKLFNIMFDGLV